MEEPTARQITLRLPKPRYRRVKPLADVRQTSISQIAREELEVLVQEALEAELRAAYDALGEDAEQTNVRLFSFARWEVVNDE